MTIPMMRRRGFGKVFASKQIKPPVMGVAAFVLSAITVVTCREVIIVAALPAFAYFGCLLLAVVLRPESRGAPPLLKNFALQVWRVAL
ncbi:hypothetical protein [Ruegeria sp. HKCCD8929]|uniref:hypothetical protein n=1 Tax=Ruegeria sp. HKCCD8929 TaxID=2683006 RepID=UPI0020C4B12C|nr:hypothetical protein [Ruegeria sp. HKCCD8929]